MVTLPGRTREYSEGRRGCGGQAWRPEESWWDNLSLQPVEQEREELRGCKVKPGLSDLDLNVEMLGQQPEMVGTRQAAALEWVRDALEMFRWRAVRKRSQWVQGHQSAGQQVEQELTATVGEGAEPFPNGRTGRSLLGHLPQETIQTQPGDEIEVDNVL
ncbi:MAG: hypothetical protein ACYTBJ_22345 [Planctomycetota bacterium]